MARRFTLLISTLVIINIIIFVIGIFGGTEYIKINEIFDNPVNTQIIFQMRLPRQIVAFFTGLTLATSGLLIQLSLKNPLADSTILGFSSGATLVAMLIILVFPSLYNYLPFLCFIGGLLAFLIIFAISLRNNSILYIIIAGIAVSAIINAIIKIVSQLFLDDIQNTFNWTNGSLTSVSSLDAKLIVTYSVVLIIICLVISYKLDLLMLNDQYLINLGINPMLFRLVICMLAIFLSGISVAFVGTISFVGLISPHIARKIVNNKVIYLMPTTMLIGSLLVMGSDTLQRIIIPTYEIPIGIIMSLVGGIFLLYLIIRGYSDRV